ncbi:MAG: RNA polymerase sigma factor [Pyrinomonadaceae bacterium]
MKAQDNASDSELLQSIQAGDENAFALLYRRRQGGIFRFALQMCGSPTLAEDVTQEVFLVLLRESHAFDPARGSLSAFLFGIARNQLLRRLQRERFYVPMDPDNDEKDDLQRKSTGPLEEISRTETIETVRRAILSLPERYREVVVLCDLEELSYVETAEILGCAIGTVRSRLHRARGLLIEKLRPADKSVAASDVKSARCFA